MVDIPHDEAAPDYVSALPPHDLYDVLVEHVSKGWDLCDTDPAQETHHSGRYTLYGRLTLLYQVVTCPLCVERPCETRRS